MKKISLILLYLLLLVPNLSNAKEYYKFDKNHTNITWQVSHFGFSSPSGKFVDVDGGFFINKAKLQESWVNINININNISTGITKFDEHLKGVDFFDAKHFPNANFQSTKIENINKNSAKIIGNLTIKNVTKEVALNIKLNKIGINPFTQKKTAGFSGETSFKRSDFGINFAIPGVSDTVKIYIEAEGNLSEMPKDISKIKNYKQKEELSNQEKIAKKMKIKEWNIIDSKSSIEILTNQNKSSINGNFKKFSGKIFFDQLFPTYSFIEFEVDINSIELSFDEAVEAVKNNIWLDSIKFPKALFRSTSIAKISDKKFLLSGVLTIKGISRNISTTFNLQEVNSRELIAEGDFTINRLDFGIGNNKDNQSKSIDQSVVIKFRIAGENLLF